MKRTNKGLVTKVVGAWLGVSAKKETPYVRLQCEMAEGEDLTHTLWLTDKTKDRSFASLKRYGFVAKKISQIGEFEDGADAAKAMFEHKKEPISVVVLTEPYTNKDGNEVEITKIESISGMGFQPKLDANQKVKFKKFDLMFTSGTDKKVEDSFDEDEKIPY